MKHKGAKFLESCRKEQSFCKGAKFLLFNMHVHKYSVMFERVKVMISIALIHLYFEGDSPLSYVKSKVLLIFFYHNCPIK